MKIKDLANLLNNQSSGYEIGKLQDFRKKIRGLQRKPCSGIFSARSIHQDYAFHAGGRTELQFNIGEEGDDQIRHGVAFSLQPSRSFTNITVLYPKIEKFNEYVISHLEDFSGFHMWSHHGGFRSEDYPVGPLNNDWIEYDNFIMLGRLSNNDEISIEDILHDFDRLLPLYEFVESQNYDEYVEEKCAETVIGDFEFNPGCPDFQRRSTVAENENQLKNVSLQHNKIQSVLYGLLCQDVGENNVSIEQKLPSGAKVDAVTRLNDERNRLYEVKVAGSVRLCLRAALGQLLEYAYWNSPIDVDELIVVGECEASNSDVLYLDTLRTTYNLPIYYQRINILDNSLGELM